MAVSILGMICVAMVYSTNSKHDMVNQTKLVVMKAYMLKNWVLEAQTVEMSVQNEGAA